MSFYNIPGVYIVEQAGPRSISPIGTSTVAFLGQPPEADAHLNEAVACNNWSEFRTKFAPGEYTDSNILANAVNGFFQNRGSRCYIVNAKKDDPLTSGLRLLETNDEISIIAAPGRFDPASHEAQAAHCEKMQDRVCILDPPPDVTNIDVLKTVETAPIPAKTKGKDATGDPGTADKPDKTVRGALPRKSAFSTMYFPWVYTADALDPKGGLVPCPPSGPMAGVWGRVDGTRGVHKAPANEPLAGALNLTYRVTAEEQGTLNPLGVNCIRYFSTQGIRVWGARTMAGEENEWRYINVRRLFIMIEQSILRHTSFAVFEPNDRSLWKTLKSVVTGFLTNVWRDGALMGRTADEAFFVKCDEETNPAESIDLGQVVVVCGIAPVKPAEFVIFKIAQTHEGAKAETL